MFSLFTLFIACSSPEFDVSGTPDGSNFTAVSAYWGGQFIVFLDQEIDCIDMYWVQVHNLQGEPPPTNRDLRALQITYNEEQIEEGTYTLGGAPAPIKTQFLEIIGDTFNVSRATDGALTLDEKIENDTLAGSLEFTFSEGTLTGSFTNIEWCNNIK